MSLDDLASGDGQHAREPDAHGQAALLIAESILHMLVERSILSVEDAVGALQTAIEVNADIAIDGDGSGQRAEASLELMFRILDSLAADLPGKRAGPARPDGLAAS
jgi:hypothetical protein